MVALRSPQSINILEAERARRDFKTFVKLAWNELEPGTPLLWNWHLDALCEHLQALQERKIQRLVIGIGPGHAKSTIVSQMFPDWVWINDPYSRWLCASHSLDLAIRDNRYRRRLIESEWFQDRYSHIFKFAPDQRMKSYFENNKKGYMLAVAVRGSGTGKRASHMLIDDANNAMAGRADIAATVEWYGKTWVSRQNDQENGMSVLVGQRLGTNDLIEHVLGLGGSEHLCLPEEFESARKCVTSIGWSDPRKEEGELLWPEKFPLPVINKLKTSLGSMDYAAQYQQAPVPSTGGQFRKDWFRYFTETDDAYILQTSNGTKSVLKSLCWTFGAVDLAISSKQTADYTVFGIFVVTPENDLLLIDVIRGRFDNPEQLRQLRLLNQRYMPAFFKIESVGYQLAFIQQGLVEGIPCKEYRPVRDKVSRASTASVWMENGKYYFCERAQYLQALEPELLTFPRGKNDDQVDVISMGPDEIVARQRPGVYSDEVKMTPAQQAQQTKESEEEIQRLMRNPFEWASSHEMGGDW